MKWSARLQIETELFHRELAYFVSRVCSEAEHAVHSSAGPAVQNLYSHVPVCTSCNDFLGLTTVERKWQCLWNSQRRTHDFMATYVTRHASNWNQTCFGVLIQSRVSLFELPQIWAFHTGQCEARVEQQCGPSVFSDVVPANCTKNSWGFLFSLYNPTSEHVMLQKPLREAWQFKIKRRSWCQIAHSRRTLYDISAQEWKQFTPTAWVKANENSKWKLNRKLNHKNNSWPWCFYRHYSLFS